MSPLQSLGTADVNKYQLILELILHAELIIYDASLLIELCRISSEFVLLLISLNNFPVPVW